MQAAVLPGLIDHAAHDGVEVQLGMLCSCQGLEHPDIDSFVGSLILPSAC